jgi:hypothetical protein
MIYTKGMDQIEKPIELEPGERLFIGNDKGDKVQIGLSNNGEIIVHSASDFCSALQVLPKAANCIALETQRG